MANSMLSESDVATKIPTEGSFGVIDETVDGTFYTIQPNYTIGWETATNQIVIINNTGNSVFYSFMGVMSQNGSEQFVAPNNSVTQNDGETRYLSGTTTLDPLNAFISDCDTVQLTFTFRYGASFKSLDVVTFNISRMGTGGGDTHMSFVIARYAVLDLE